MSIELDYVNPACDVSDYLDWALETGIWNGRQVSWSEASEFCDQVQARICELLLNTPNAQSFEQLSAQFAWIGTPAGNQSLLARDVQELDFSKSNLIYQVGLKKSLSKFWKKHHKEILIGVAIVAVATVVVVVAVSTGGSAAGPTAAAGSAALGTCSDKDKNDKPAPKNPPLKEEKPSPECVTPDIAQISPLSLDSSLTNNNLIFGETGILIDGKYSSYSNILLNRIDPSYFIDPHPCDFSTFVIPRPESKTDTPTLEWPSSDPTSPAQSQPLIQRTQPWIANFLDTIGRSIIDSPELFDPNTPLPSRELSSRFSTLGERISHQCFATINGINTTKEEALDHANYLASFLPGRCIDWVYNRSHGPVIDLAEVLTLNYAGYSPNTSELLRENWKTFHILNENSPNAKYLQFCHSQGALHVRNALAKAPKEIRDRVIVVAIAPATVIQPDLCFQTFNYVCKGDPIPYGEYALLSAFDGNEFGMAHKLEFAHENHKYLIVVEPHPDTKSPHDFQNPTFIPQITERITDYLEHNGEYN